MRLVHLVLAAVLSVGVAGCENRDFRVAVVTSYHPWTYIDAESGEIAGADVEIVRALCRELGLKPTFKAIVWSEKRKLLELGEVDAIFGGFTITGRERDYAILGPYAKGGQAVMVTGSNTARRVDDLAGQVVAVQRGAVSEAMFEPGGALQGLGNRLKELVTCESIDNVMLFLRNGIIDGAVLDFDAARDFERRANGRVRRLDGLLNEEWIGAGFRRGDEARRDAFAKALHRLFENGEMARIGLKYFGDPGRFTDRRPR